MLIQSHNQNLWNIEYRKKTITDQKPYGKTSRLKNADSMILTTLKDEDNQIYQTSKEKKTS